MKKYNLLIALIGVFVLSAATLDLNNLINYVNQSRPSYILKDNTPSNNPITNKGATLGRVLFYDKQLSVNNNKACATCHQQQFAFTDTIGFGGYVTDSNSNNLISRRSMRLVNSRFGVEAKFFWDERATSLENQTSEPIKDHNELGFSNTNGAPGIAALIDRMETLPYYPELFNLVYGSPEITEAKIQLALAQFIRSIQSYDSKYDIGRAQVGADNVNFPNFTTEENIGKALFLAPPPNGAGCQGCHVAPEFDIVATSLNNGNVASDSGSALDINNTRAPSLRDLVNPYGMPNGPFMHNGKFNTLLEVIEHYNHIEVNPANTNLDPKLRRPGGLGQDLNLTSDQKNALVAFLKTLTGTDLYTNARWSSPFNGDGTIDLDKLTNGLSSVEQQGTFAAYPNPASSFITLDLPEGTYNLQLFNIQGRLVQQISVSGKQPIDIASLHNGVYILSIQNTQLEEMYTQKLYKVSR